MLEWVCASLALLTINPVFCSIDGETTRLVEDQVRVTRIIDGDTLDADHPARLAGFRIRLLDIDTPEMRGRCDAEKTKASRAKARLAQLLPVGAMVTIKSGSPSWNFDRYGRLLAHVHFQGINAGKQMVLEGLAQPWRPSLPKVNWCAL